MPKFSILTPVYNVPQEFFADTAESVINQSFKDWEWVLVDDASPSEHVLPMLEEFAARDARIKVVRSEVNGGIVVASNKAIAHATGEFMALLDHDDLLALQALERVDDVISSHFNVDIVYTDEDKLGANGEYYDRVTKPVWSPEKLRGQMYLGHLGVYRSSLIRKIGGFRPECEGSQDHDLALRASELARNILHVPEVLYHWRVVPGSTAATVDNKPYTWEAGLVAVQDHLKRTKMRATAEFGPAPSHYTVIREPDLETPVSIVIPTRGSVAVVDKQERVLIVTLIESILANTAHKNMEFVIVYDTVTPVSVMRELADLLGDRLVAVEYDKPFNFSEKCNIGAIAASNETIIFLNDDMECVSEEVIGQLIAPLRESGVGATGARLLFEDGSIQHAGHLHHYGEYTLNYHGAPNHATGNFGALLINREVSGVTGACIAMSKKLFMAVGGFSELFPNSYNDVDLCNKITATGTNILWLANTTLRHFESKSRVPNVDPADYYRISSRWGSSRDPFYA